jgi:endonuclease III
MDLYQKKTRAVLKKLRQEYPDLRPQLHFSTPFELLVATMLSAQCTDARVNIVTPGLFTKYPSVTAFARAPLSELEKHIYSTGFYRNKAKNIKASAQIIGDVYGGEVPATMEGLLTLPGVARKTANIVLQYAFNRSEGIAVDTHVKRLSRRIGFSDSDNPLVIERDLMRLVAPKDWHVINSLLIQHGRAVCQARRALCDVCSIGDECRSCATQRKVKKRSKKISR